MRGGIQAVLRAMETFPQLPNLQVPKLVKGLDQGRECAASCEKSDKCQHQWKLAGEDPKTGHKNPFPNSPPARRGFLDFINCCRTSARRRRECQIECQKECQNRCQIECQKECRRECQNRCQKECQNECLKRCGECQNRCQIACQKECQR